MAHDHRVERTDVVRANDCHWRGAEDQIEQRFVAGPDARLSFGSTVPYRLPDDTHPWSATLEAAIHELSVFVKRGQRRGVPARIVDELDAHGALAQLLSKQLDIALGRCRHGALTACDRFGQKRHSYGEEFGIVAV